MIQAVKASATASDPGLCLPVRDEQGALVALLRPVRCVGATRPADVERLTAWRNRFVRAFLTEFEATPARTASWLVDHVAPDPGKILFMVDLPDGVTIGYMGLDKLTARSIEADAIVRGQPAPAGTMRAALLRLLAWAHHGLGVPELRVRVLADNHACDFYRGLGFVDERREPLVRREVGAEVHWIPAPAGPRELVHMSFRGTLPPWE